MRILAYLMHVLSSTRLHSRRYQVRAHIHRPIAFLKIAVTEARNLLNADAGGLSDPFAVVYHDPQYNFFDPSEIGRTETINDTLNPDWNKGVDSKDSASVWNYGFPDISSATIFGVGDADSDEEGSSLSSSKAVQGSNHASPFAYLWKTNSMAYEPRACWRYPILQPFTKIAGTRSQPLAWVP